MEGGAVAAASSKIGASLTKLNQLTAKANTSADRLVKIANLMWGSAPDKGPTPITNASGLDQQIALLDQALQRIVAQLDRF